MLTEPAVVRLIEEAVRREAGKKLLDAMQRLRAANVPPLAEEDIAAEVKVTRAARRASGETGRSHERCHVGFALARQSGPLARSRGERLGDALHQSGIGRRTQKDSWLAKARATH